MVKKILKMLLFYVIGSVILAIGIDLSILSNLGAGAFDALNSNFSKLLNISLGFAMNISIIIIFIITLILKPKIIYIVGVLLSIILGLELNLFLELLPRVDNYLLLRIIYFILSIILLPLGVTFIIRSKLPLSPVDNLLIILVEKTNGSIMVIKTLIEASFALIAMIYGMAARIGPGELSIGTIIITFTIGPGIDFFMKYTKSLEIKN